MSTMLEPVSLDSFVEPRLLKGVVTSTINGFEMCGLHVRMVGVATVPAQESGQITGLIGVHGKVNGFITLNLSETTAVKAVEGLLQEKFGKLTPEVIDGTGEVTNIVAGGIKAQLAGSNWSFGQITVPSVIVGRGYQIAFNKGLEQLSVTFDVQDSTALTFQERLVHVSLSLLRL